MPGQRVANRVVRVVLRTPLLCRVVGGRLLTIEVVGRTSGRHFVVPVAYTRHEGALLVGTPFGWARNLRTGDLVKVRLQGRRRTAEVRVIKDEDGVIEHYVVIARDNRQFAKFNKIGFDADGEPSRKDLQRRWADGARVLVLSVR